VSFAGGAADGVPRALAGEEETIMTKRTGHAELRWPEIAAASIGVDKAMRGMVFPVMLEDGGRCFGVAIDQRWLRGSDGEMIFFDGIAAASRFLQLLRAPVLPLSFGPLQVLRVNESESIQCYSLTRAGLASCNRCRLGQRSRAVEAREYARLDDRW
jgi:hypothetical protein